MTPYFAPVFLTLQTCLGQYVRTNNTQSNDSNHPSPNDIASSFKDEDQQENLWTPPSRERTDRTKKVHLVDTSVLDQIENNIDLLQRRSERNEDVLHRLDFLDVEDDPSDSYNDDAIQNFLTSASRRRLRPTKDRESKRVDPLTREELEQLEKRGYMAEMAPIYVGTAPLLPLSGEVPKKYMPEIGNASRDRLVALHGSHSDSEKWVKKFMIEAVNPRLKDFSQSTYLKNFFKYNHIDEDDEVAKQYVTDFETHFVGSYLTIYTDFLDHLDILDQLEESSWSKIMDLIWPTAEEIQSGYPEKSGLHNDILRAVILQARDYANIQMAAMADNDSDDDHDETQHKMKHHHHR